MSATLFKNARIVMADEVVHGCVQVVDGRIVTIDPGTPAMTEGIDLQGDYLMPGFVEIHTDNFERHLMPRPKVQWAEMPALLAHDAEVAAAGITTVFDALGVGDADPDSLRGSTWEAVIDTIDTPAAGTIAVGATNATLLTLATNGVTQFTAGTGGVQTQGGGVAGYSIGAGVAAPSTVANTFAVAVGAAGTMNIQTTANAASINIGTGAAANLVTLGTQTGAAGTTINGGTSGITIGIPAAANAGVQIQGGIGASAFQVGAAGTLNLATNAVAATVNLGTGAAAQTVTIGSTNTTSSLALKTGTGTLDLSGGATDHTTTLGSTTGTSTCNINAGTGAINIRVQNGGNIGLGDNAVAQGVFVGTGAATVALTAGSTSAGATTLIQGGTGASAINVQPAAGGNTVLTLGAASNLSIGTAAGSYQSMSKGVFIGNAAANPSGNPTAGGFLYATGGAGTWRGSGGTVTTFGPAEPHCETCGADFGTQWEHAETGEKTAVCMPCLIDALAAAGISTSFAFIHRRNPAMTREKRLAAREEARAAA